MKILKFLLSITIILFCWSCQNNHDVECSILEEELFGEWEVMGFAFCDNHKKIKNETLIPDREKFERIGGYEFRIEKLESANFEFDTTLLSIHIQWYHSHFFFYIDNCSMIFFKEIPPSEYFFYTHTEAQIEIMHAIRNTRNYVIKENELRIYFTGKKDKNLIILKKIEKNEQY